MPFSIATKNDMFIQSSRLCCLCLKQCGINIEAAHIIAEGDGGSNEFDNGIPVCFDCHTEIGSYNDKHPKGNKFRPEELKARRDRVYGFVDSGVIYAQVIAQRIRSSVTDPTMAEFGDTPETPRASAEAKQFLKVLLSPESLDAAARKLGLLNEQDRAFVLDELLRAGADNPHMLSVIARIVGSPVFPQDQGTLLIEKIVRGLTLYGDTPAKAEFLETISDDMLNTVYEGLRLAFFEDLIGIVNQDQFDDVNKIVPAMTAHVSTIPPELYKDYVFALFQQARSLSFDGAPAARRALLSLPDDAAKAAMNSMDTEFLWLNSRHESVREFAARYMDLSEGPRRELFEDLAKLSNREFVEKHIPSDSY